jgi:hypothetical protein
MFFWVIALLLVAGVFAIVWVLYLLVRQWL